MGLKIANQAYGILASGISSGATAVPLSSGHGARFGTFAAGDYMFATLISNANQLEIVKITGRSGDNLTVVRGQDGTSAMAFSAGERIECRPCNASFKAAMLEAGYSPESGAANAYVLTMDVGPAAYFEGMRAYFKATNTNTGASTVNINSLGAVAIKQVDGSDLAAGQIRAGAIFEIVYQGTNFQLINPSELLVGKIEMYGAAAVPSGWLACDGAAVSRSTYAGLFAVIGTTWGVGDGATTFNVPNMKGRSPVGVGQGNTLEGGGAGTNRALAAAGGAEGHKLVTAEMPAHTHGINGISDVGGGANNYRINAPGATVLTTSTGGDGSHNNMHPFVTVNFIIKT